jgi:hypothetical protein
MSRVFVSQQTLRHSDINDEMVQVPSMKPAQAFGEVIFLIDWFEAMDMSDEEMLWAMRRRLADFCDDDYLLPLGSPFAMSLSALVASEANDGKVRILQWNRDNREYLVRTCDMLAQPLNHRIGEMA